MQFRPMPVFIAGAVLCALGLVFMSSVTAGLVVSAVLVLVLAVGFLSALGKGMSR